MALFNGGLNGFGNGFNQFDRNRPEWFATVRGRVGYAWDRLLIYATGGVAFRDDNNNDCSNGFGCGFGFGTGIASGAALVGTGFYTTPGAAIAGNAVVPTNAGFFFLTIVTTTSAGRWAAASSTPSPMASWASTT